VPSGKWCEGQIRYPGTCGAPVFSLSGNGKGQHSKLALGYVIENLKRSGEKEHFIEIKSKKG
jgi:hypothetical protein